MAGVVAPLLSFGASGAIAKTQVYATWKGRPYARRYVVPANPNTTDQQETRNTFKFLNDLWRFMPATAIDGWNAYANASRFTARNGFLKQNLADLRSQADLANFIFSPAAAGGLVADSMVVTPGSLQLSVALTAPSLPAGWSISKGIAACVRDQDPQSGTLFDVTAGTDATDPYAIVLTGLTATVDYIVGGWFEFTKPDGNLAYGISLMDSAQPTA